MAELRTSDGMSACEPIVWITTLELSTPRDPRDDAEETDGSPESGLFGKQTALRVFRGSDAVQTAKNLLDAGVKPQEIRPHGRRRAERSIVRVVPTNISIDRHH